MITTKNAYWPVLVFVIVAVIVLAFGASFFHDFSAVDDYALIVQNLAVRKTSLASIAWFFTHFDPELYIPLTYVSFFIDHTLFGLSSSMFHLHNLVLHGLNALLVALLLQKLFESRWIAAAGALLFAVHPLNTEAVVWIAARKDLLSTFFALSSVLLFIRNRERGGSKTLAASLICFVLALLAKVSVAPLPIVLLIWSLMRGSSWRSSLRSTSPFFLFTIVFVIVALIGKSNIAFMDLPERIVLALYAAASVIGRMLLPIHLSVFHQPPALDVSTMLIAAIVPLLLIAAWFMRRRMPLVMFGIVWILLFLALPSFNVQTDLHAAGATFAADRYGYLPMIGLLLILCEMLRRVCSERTSTFVLVALTLFFIPFARLQTAVWDSPESLFRNAVEIDPSSTSARIALVRTLHALGKIEEAFDVLREGLRYDDTKDMHLVAGEIYVGTNQLDDAREQFALAMQRDPQAPEPYFAMGELELYLQNDGAALIAYDQALEREPRFAEAMARKAILLPPSEAERLLRQAVAIEPKNRDALLQLGALLLDKQSFDEVQALIDDAALLYPDDPEVQSLRARILRAR